MASCPCEVAGGLLGAMDCGHLVSEGSLVKVLIDLIESGNQGNLTPRKDETYPKQMFSHITTDGTSDSGKKKKCYNLRGQSDVV